MQSRSMTAINTFRHPCTRACRTLTPHDLIFHPFGMVLSRKLSLRGPIMEQIMGSIPALEVGIIQIQVYSGPPSETSNQIMNPLCHCIMTPSLDFSPTQTQPAIPKLRELGPSRRRITRARIPALTAFGPSVRPVREGGIVDGSQELIPAPATIR